MPSLEAVASTRVSPDFFAPVRLPAEAPPQLFVIVDTEEEFDWSRRSRGERQRDGDRRGRPAAGRAAAVQAQAHVRHRLSGGVDAGVGSSGWREFAGEGRVPHRRSPPSVGESAVPPSRSVRATSYACNLGADLERAKISALREAIVANLGVTPRVYKAGRYGFGRTTADTLEALGFDVDVSVNPHMDFDERRRAVVRGLRRPRPGSSASARRLLEVPCTTGVRRRGAPPGRAAAPRGVGVVAAAVQGRRRARAHGHAQQDHAVARRQHASTRWSRATETLIDDGVRTLSLTFHSPSLKPGCTPLRAHDGRARRVSEDDRSVLRLFPDDSSRSPGTPETVRSTERGSGAWRSTEAVSHRRRAG